MIGKRRKRIIAEKWGKLFFHENFVIIVVFTV
jgi:hypothetical protein